MKSCKKRGLTVEVILKLVLDSDAESDICYDDDVLLDHGEYQNDESGSDEEKIVCSMDILNPQVFMQLLNTQEMMQ